MRGLFTVKWSTVSANWLRGGAMHEKIRISLSILSVAFEICVVALALLVMLAML